VNPSLVTILVPFLAGGADGRSDCVTGVNNTLDCLGDPAGGFAAIEAALNGGRIHFMSMVVVPPEGAEQYAHLVIELNGDGTPGTIIDALVDAIPQALGDVIAAANIAVPERNTLESFLRGYLRGHQQRFAYAIGRPAGLMFVGTPGLTVRRILEERAFAAYARDYLAEQHAGSALGRLESLRSQVFEDPDWKWALVSEPMAMIGEEKSPYGFAFFFALVRDFFWWMIPPPVLVFFYSFSYMNTGIRGTFWDVVGVLIGEFVVLGLILVGGYALLRHAEKNDVPIDEEPSEPVMAEVLARENRPGCVQNHLTGISRLKPGWVRYVTLRIGFWVIAESGVRRSKPGFIDKIGTIHFARWVHIPGTDRLLFLSNYDGNWQGYLEDFIQRLREGLTSVWSNTRNFPKTTRLLTEGASDGARFKRWARRQQIPTRFWFSAYPDLTTSQIRTNARIRHGFASAMTEGDAATWLGLFGFASRETLESAEIPVLAFGGLSRLPHSHCMLLEFCDGPSMATWLRAIQPHVTHGEMTPRGGALTVAFTSHGLRKLGLDRQSISTFPIAFQQGMCHAGRVRALQDDTTTWSWGTRGEIDAVLMLYAPDAARLATERERRTRELAPYAAIRDIDLQQLEGRMREPFGFRDGISQPVMRGSKRWSRTARDTTHTVEPGELILGYGDNLGKVAPMPRIRGSDLGRNGTYLVIRQIEQHVQEFSDYLENQANELEGRPGVPRGTVRQRIRWIAAKMMGRWPDGSSLVRHPDGPGGRKAGSDNLFLFGREDADGLRCPLGAHIRRANPRDTLESGSATQIRISNRHRILRVGRIYEDTTAGQRGLLFMCVNADIERQFEFLQQAWILGANFHGLNNEIDPVVGYRGANDYMTVPTPEGPVRLAGISRFVTTRGGAYFFMPGRNALRILANL
jgi:Dyp-type peroxidase family